MIERLTKAECRKVFSEKRAQCSPQDVLRASEQIQSLLFSSFDLTGKTVSLFLPIEQKNEIDTYPILQKALSLGARVCLPKADFSSKEMTHILYEDASQLNPSYYGIPEPTMGTVIPPNKIDLVIVPLLAFDIRGYRVGYGMGFYDRFLAKCRPDTLFIGLSGFDPIAEITDTNPLDLKLHYCITPLTRYTF